MGLEQWVKGRGALIYPEERRFHRVYGGSAANDRYLIPLVLGLDWGLLAYHPPSIPYFSYFPR